MIGIHKSENLHPEIKCNIMYISLKKGKENAVLQVFLHTWFY